MEFTNGKILGRRNNEKSFFEFKVGVAKDFRESVVKELLLGSSRPLTYREVVQALALRGVSEGRVNRELVWLRKVHGVEKVLFEVWGYRLR